MIAWMTLMVGIIMFNGVLLYLGQRWLRLQEREMSDKFDDSDDLAPEDFVNVMRLGPKEKAEAEKAAWAREQEARGKSDEQIRRDLEERQPILFL